MAVNADKNHHHCKLTGQQEREPRVLRGKNKNLTAATRTVKSSATWMDLETVTLTEVSQTEKDKYNMTSLICGL